MSEDIEIKYIKALLSLMGKQERIKQLEKRVKELEYQLYLKNAGYTTAEGSHPRWSMNCEGSIGRDYIDIVDEFGNKVGQMIGSDAHVSGYVIRKEGDPNGVTV